MWVSVIICIYLLTVRYYMWDWGWFVYVCVSATVFSCHSHSRLQGDRVCTYSHSLPRTAGILATRCQIWSCIRFHVSSPVTCSKEYPLEYRGRGGRRGGERGKRTEGDRQRQKMRTGQKERVSGNILHCKPKLPQFINTTDTVLRHRCSLKLWRTRRLQYSPYFSKSIETKHYRAT